jgi:septum formation protein
MSEAQPVREIVLASTSATRKRILEDAGIDVRCEASGVDERAVRDPDPERLALNLARAKACAVASRFPSAWVLGADQVVFDGSEVFGKPDDPADHERRLTSMRGRAHDLITAVVLIGPEGESVEMDRTRMHVRGDITDDEIRAYVQSGEGSWCAGGYAAEGRGAFLFERIEGDFFNVLGLPLHRVLGMLRARGWRYGAHP